MWPTEYSNTIMRIRIKRVCSNTAECVVRKMVFAVRISRNRAIRKRKCVRIIIVTGRRDFLFESIVYLFWWSPRHRTRRHNVLDFSPSKTFRRIYFIWTGTVIDRFPDGHANNKRNQLARRPSDILNIRPAEKPLTLTWITYRPLDCLVYPSTRCTRVLPYFCQNHYIFFV